MHAEPRLLDWATALESGGPTWLEIVASHAHLLSATDARDESRTSAVRSPRADEARQWMSRIRPELSR
jgi:hypothetical protein